MILIRKGNIFVPEKIGVQDILISEKIEEIGKDLDITGINELNCENLIIVPGFIDIHNHINGAGGEGGPNFRTLPLKVNELLKSGITTVVGLLGTDGYTRYLIDLLYHARKLNLQGINSYIYTGSYQVPGPTITGSIANDIILIPEILGVKMAISDHRSSYPTKKDIINIASETRVSALISDKAGIVHVHMGDGKEAFNPILEVIEETDIPITQFIPTHINRNEDLLESSIEYGKRKGYLDLTATLEFLSPHKNTFSKTLKSAKYLVSKGVNLNNITISSDGNGSFPTFNKNGELSKIEISPYDSLIKLFNFVWFNENNFIVNFLKMISENPGERLKLRKGRIEKGYDADF